MNKNLTFFKIVSFNFSDFNTGRSTYENFILIYEKCASVFFFKRPQI